MTVFGSRSNFDGLLRSREACAIFAPMRQLQSMLDFEAALAKVEARLGMIPSGVVSPIVACCQASLFDQEALVKGTARSGNLAIPMVSLLTRAVKDLSPEASGYIHWGATSQDAVDTGLVLQLRDLLILLDRELLTLSERLATLTAEHRATPMVGRTWLQQAVPITLGLKTAGWLDVTLRNRERLAQLRSRVLVVQFGGAAGTLASLNSQGLVVAAELAKELDLGVPDLPWHTNRDRIVEVATFLGGLMGSIGKIARDISLLGQTEIAEVAEAAAPGRGGSSTMPHKRNPVSAAAVLSSAIRVPGLVSTMLYAMNQEHERGLGGWHAEWETLPEICTLTLGSLESLTENLVGLEVFPNAMKANLEKTHGLIFTEAVTMAVAEKIGRSEAHTRMQNASYLASKSGGHLRSIVEQDPVLMAALEGRLLDELFSPASYLGDTNRMIDNVLAQFSAVSSPRLEGS